MLSTVCSAHFFNVLLPLFILFIGCASDPEISVHELLCSLCYIRVFKHALTKPPVDDMHKTKSTICVSAVHALSPRERTVSGALIGPLFLEGQLM